MGLPPCGGSGLKCFENGKIERKGASPSMRREWIEIAESYEGDDYAGSPSMRREWIEMFQGHELDKEHLSPSMRREWIEIRCQLRSCGVAEVSLHAEGVD